MYSRVFVRARVKRIIISREEDSYVNSRLAIQRVIFVRISVSINRAMFVGTTRIRGVHSRIRARMYTYV